MVELLAEIRSKPGKSRSECGELEEVLVERDEIAEKGLTGMIGGKKRSSVPIIEPDLRSLFFLQFTHYVRL